MTRIGAATTRVGEAARLALDAGVAAIPIRSDGTKRPAIAWATYQTELPTETEIDGWFAGLVGGIAFVCGVASGNLEVLDFDDANTYATFLETAEELGLGEIVDKIRAGYEERTPGGGAHLPYYCETISGNQKLARRPPTAEELAQDPKATAVALIETRGIGGYFIAAPSNGTVHPNGGAWRIVAGNVGTIETVTASERLKLHELARTFDQLPPLERLAAIPSGTKGDRPGDDYRERHRSLGAFAGIVERHGWKLVHRRGETGYFRRPGKSESWSATYNHEGCGLFYVFTSSAAPFEPEHAYNPFSVYALLEHGGDFSAAAKALAKDGYGKQKGPSLGEITFTKRKTEKEVAFKPTEIPTAAVKGWMRDYVALVSDTTESPDAFHVASAFTFLGACIGKRVGLLHASDQLFANFYTLLIGPSGRSRKDTAVRRMLNLFYAAPPPGEPLVAVGSPFKVVRDISSSEGLIAMLRKQANLVLYTSEFSKLMSNAARESTRSIGPTLIEAFDTPPSLENNTVANVDYDGPPKIAKNPYVSVISTVQPEILAELIGGQHQYSGFLNRWLLVVGDGKGAKPNPPNVDEHEAYRIVRRAMAAVLAYPENTLLMFDDEAGERWSDWYVTAYPTGRETAQEDAMGIRRGTLIKKIALVQAVLDGADCIGVEQLEVGMSFGDWCWEHTRRLLPTWGESKDAELARKILERLAERGPMKKRQLQMLTGNRLGPGVFARIIKSMVENGQIALADDNVVYPIADE